MATQIEKLLNKAFHPTPKWVFKLMFPTDKVVLESLDLDDLFDWHSQITAGNPMDVWDMFFLVSDETKISYAAWWDTMYHQKKAGSVWRRIRAVPARIKRRLPWFGRGEPTWV